MINVRFFVSDGLIYGFELSGHANFASIGSDIVCAAVSSAADMTANTITEILKLNADVVGSDDGYLSLKLYENDVSTAQAVLKGFRLHMKSISEDYPANVKIRYGGTKNA